MLHTTQLRLALLANTLFSGLSGALFVLFAPAIATWAGLSQGWPVQATGLALLLFAGHLGWSAQRGPSRAEIVYFVAADLSWVVLSLALALSASPWFTARGHVALAALSVPVAILATLQGSAGLRAGRRAAWTSELARAATSGSAAPLANTPRGRPNGRLLTRWGPRPAHPPHG